VLTSCVGTVDLPLKSAQVLDPDRIGLDFWRAGSPANDPRFEICERRLRCYDLVLNSLTVFEEKMTNPKVPEEIAIESEAVRNHAYELSFASDDEMFHSTLYDWLIKRGVADELLEVRPTIPLS
jgi:nuclear pore complex protein Nup155